MNWESGIIIQKYSFRAIYHHDLKMYLGLSFFFKAWYVVLGSAKDHGSNKIPTYSLVSECYYNKPMPDK